jgi:hypothetical protein
MLLKKLTKKTKEQLDTYARARKAVGPEPWLAKTLGGRVGGKDLASLQETDWVKRHQSFAAKERQRKQSIADKVKKMMKK